MEKRLHLEEEAARCLLCADAPCSKACRSGDPARAIRAIRFGNAKLAGRWVVECTDDELEAAEQACIHYDRPIRIREMLAHANADLESASQEPGISNPHLPPSPSPFAVFPARTRSSWPHRPYVPTMRW